MSHDAVISSLSFQEAQLRSNPEDGNSFVFFLLFHLLLWVNWRCLLIESIQSGKPFGEWLIRIRPLCTLYLKGGNSFAIETWLDGRIIYLGFDSLCLYINSHDRWSVAASRLCCLRRSTLYSHRESMFVSSTSRASSTVQLVSFLLFFFSTCYAALDWNLVFGSQANGFLTGLKREFRTSYLVKEGSVPRSQNHVQGVAEKKNNGCLRVRSERLHGRN